MATNAIATEILFAQKLLENRIFYESFDTEAPDDATEIKEALLQKRETPEWAHCKWEKMKVAMRSGVEGELSLESMIVESMLTQHDHISPPAYQRFRNEQWTEVDNEITAGISDPKPDIIETYLWSDYPPETQEIFEELVISQYSYAMPTFAMESKGASAYSKQAVRQAAYDGAVMTWAAITFDSHVGRDDCRFRKTKAITIALSPENIIVFANHAVEEKPGGAKISYHQHELLTVNYLRNEAEWNRAHSVLFNAQKFALDLADARIKQIRDYLDAQKLRRAELKLKQSELQQEARAKTMAAVKKKSSGRPQKPKGIDLKPPV